MKILITHFFTRKNKGDAAINSVLLSQLKKTHPNAEIVISSADSFESDERFEGHRFVSSILHEALYVSTHPVARILRTLFVLTASLLWILTNKKIYVPRRLHGFLQELSAADIVIPTGGSYLLADSSLLQNIVLLLQLWPLLLAKWLNKKVTMYAQSIGPFENIFAKWIARYVLNSVHSISVREPLTRAILKDLGINKPTIKFAIDGAFLFKSPYKVEMRKFLLRKGIKDSKIKIGITVKRCYDDSRQQAYEDEMGAFTTYLVKKYDAQVIFIAQCTSALHNDDDRVVAKRIAGRLANKKSIFVLEEEFDHYHIKSVFENMDYLVATRMHSAIFSITAHVPTLAIAYEHKTKGIMSALGLQKWCIPVDDVNLNTLREKFDSLYTQKHI